MFASGFTSSPSNTPAPFDGPRFPAIAIRDNVEASRRVLTELGVTHFRGVVGYSMGAQQAFQWAVSYPDLADRIVAYCGTAKTYPHGVVRLEGTISQARTWQHNNVGDTPGFGGDHERALRSIRVPVRYMPSQTDLYFRLGDAQYESQFIKGVQLVPIPTLWGHRAGLGNSLTDNEFLNAEILRFLP